MLLFDSNITIYLSNKTLTISEIARRDDVLFVSLVTYMEVAGYRFGSDAEERFVAALFHTLQQLPVTQRIAERVVGYRKLRKIKLPDAIILATAREYDCQLVARNLSDFIGLDNEVTIINPFNK